MKRSLLTLALLSALGGCGSGEEESDKDQSSRTTKAGTIVIENVSVREGHAGNTEAVMRINRSDGKDGVITGRFHTVAGTAETGVDFIETTGTFELADGVSRAEITVQIIGDTHDEEDETFGIELSEITGAAAVDRSAAVFTISNDDDAPEVSFTSEIWTTSEGSGKVDIPVQLSSPSGKEIWVKYSLGGLAIEFQDYNDLSNESIQFLPGETLKHIELEITEDDVPEGGENIRITLSDPNNVTLSDQSESSVIILGDLVLNDTGVTLYVNGDNFTAPTAPNNLPGQDADYGPDAQPDLLELDGHAGFSFTKLDRAGNALPHTATSWSCVLDNRTGVVWENKYAGISDIPSNLTETEFNAMLDDAWRSSRNPESSDYIPYPYYHWHENWRANNYRYTWYNKDGATAGGSPGSEAFEFDQGNAPVHNKAQCAFPTADNLGFVRVNSCSTYDYISVANVLAVCGFKDWRLPTMQELRSIANFETNLPLLDTSYFNNHVTGAPIWSSTPSANGEGSAWCMDSETGQAKLCHKQSNSASIRLARGGKQ